MDKKIKLPEIPKSEKYSWEISQQDFWLLLTGHEKPIEYEDIFDDNSPTKDLKFPESELQPSCDDLKIKNFDFSSWTHFSWFGFNDSVRAYSFEGEGLEKIQKRLQKNHTLISLPNKMGFYIQTKIPAIVKNKGKLRFFNKFKKGHINGYVFLLNQEKIKSGLDLLFFADSIAKLHPETAKSLITQMIGKISIAKQQAEVWKQALEDNKDLKIPDEFISTTSDVLEYIENIDKELENFLDQLFQRLNPEDVEKEKQKIQAIQKEVSQVSLLFKEQTKQKISKTIQNILKRHSEDSDRTQKLIKYILKRSKREILQNSFSVSEALSHNPQVWVLEEVVRRGQNVLIDNLPPSPAMVKHFKREKPGASLPETVSEWLEKLKIPQIIRKEWRKYEESLQKAESIDLTEEEQKEFNTKQRFIEVQIKLLSYNHFIKLQNPDKYLNKKLDTPIHPIFENWENIKSTINSSSNKVKEKLLLIYNAKKKLAEMQKKYTDLFVKITSKEHGGYKGWNEKIKKKMQSFFETSPHLISIFEEMNCAGKTLFVSKLLEKTGIFKRNDVFTNCTYGHVFLSSDDTLGVRRYIEPSDLLKYSVCGVPKEKTFYDHRYGTTISFPVREILFTDNFALKINQVELKKKLHILLLQHSEYLNFNSWYRLSKSLHSEEKLFSYLRGVVIDKCFKSIEQVLIKIYNQEEYKEYDPKHILEEALKENSFNQLLPYIKLNLLIIKQYLNENRYLKEHINKIKKMNKNLEELLNLLQNINIPSGWDRLSNITAAVLQQKAWNPDLFPKPFIDEDGEIGWIMPDSNTH